MFPRTLLFYLILFLPFLSEAKTTTAIANNGNWTTAGTWDNGVPAAGDVIIIPPGITVNITGGTINLRGGGATTVSIGGTLSMSNGAVLWIDSALDALNVLDGGSIVPVGLFGGRIDFGDGFCCGLPGAIVIINNFLGSEGPVTGPVIISNGVLPITLLSFTAIVSNSQVELEWHTASELNNNFFTIERSADAESFAEILTVKGKGTTNVEHVYRASDKNPIIGRAYYRLKQTDFDGAVTYTDLVTVEYEGPSFALLQAYPNPSLGSKLTLQLKGVREVMDVPFRIVSQQGQLVYEGIMHVDESGKSTNEIEFQVPLTAGLYIVKAGPSVFLTQKVAVIR